MIDLDAIRKPAETVSTEAWGISAFVYLLWGAALGWLAKYLDNHTQSLGNIFSQMSVWILLGVWISVNSKTPGLAAVKELSFCFGMLAAYYLTAELTHSVYGQRYVIGWGIFSLFSPVFSFLTWYSVGKGWFAKVLRFGILIVLLLCARILFDHIRIADLLIAAVTAYVLFRHGAV